MKKAFDELKIAEKKGAGMQVELQSDIHEEQRGGN